MNGAPGALGRVVERQLPAPSVGGPRGSQAANDGSHQGSRPSAETPAERAVGPTMIDAPNYPYRRVISSRDAGAFLFLTRI